MPHFYLHIDDGMHRVFDEEGSELPDLYSARQEVLGAARQLWAAAILTQRDIGTLQFVIVNDAGKVIDTLSLDEALPTDLLDRLRIHEDGHGTD